MLEWLLLEIRGGASVIAQGKHWCGFPTARLSVAIVYASWNLYCRNKHVSNPHISHSKTMCVHCTIILWESFKYHMHLYIQCIAYMNGAKSVPFFKSRLWSRWRGSNKNTIMIGWFRASRNAEEALNMWSWWRATAENCSQNFMTFETSVMPLSQCFDILEYTDP